MLGEGLPYLVQIDTMPLLHKGGYEFDIGKRKDTRPTSLVCVRIVCGAVCPEILKAPVNEGLLDTQNKANLIYRKILLIEQYGNASLQVARYSVRRHRLQEMTTHTRNRTPGQARVGHGPKKKKKTFPQTYEKSCNSDSDVGLLT